LRAHRRRADPEDGVVRGSASLSTNSEAIDTAMSERIPVGILGATGMVGQEFVSFLSNHPWFDLTFLGASDRSAGKTYQEATSWRLSGVMPPNVRSVIVAEAKPVSGAPKLMFSAMDAGVATEIERAFAGAGHVIVSNSRNHRMEP